MKKSRFYFVLIIIMAVSLIFAFAGCGEPDDNDNNGGDTGDKGDIDSHVHSYDKWTLVEAPTENTLGVMQAKCATCGEVINVALPILNEINYTIEEEPATCTKEGKLKATEIGEFKFSFEIVLPKLPHTYGDWEMTTVPTETTTGFIKRTCTCGAVEEYELPKLTDEDYTIERVEPTCIADGYIKAKLNRKEMPYTVNITLPKTNNHSYVDKSNATHHWKECSVCGAVKDKAEHTYGTDHKCTVCGAFDENYCTDGLEFVENSDNTYKVTKYNGTDADVVIPKYYKGKPVTIIGESAFYIYDTPIVKSIHIPDSITTLEDIAFVDTELETIHLPKSVTHIGNASIAMNNKLRSITIDPNNDTYKVDNNTIINKNTNELKQALVNGNISSYVTSIAPYGLAYTELSEVTIPSGVVSLGRDAFENCEALSIIRFEKGSKLNNIGASVFFGTKATEIEIPASVKYIDATAFKGSHIEKVYLHSDINLDNVGFSGQVSKSMYSLSIPTTTPPAGFDSYWHYGTDGVTPVVWNIV